ncbi:MAG: multiple sugar transport system substrate-binding protein [Phycisphaerales bacterium]|jgi:ABC-type glycerol-3-phosphate transport system substrate-binding protein|nr:multiple sugar transport system substrate-binding protein [Phycisphaerales bacterium]
MKWISRAILFLMLLGGAALLAFGPRPNAHVPPGRLVLSYWEKWTGPDADAMRQIVDDFNNTVGAEKGLYVRMISLANVQHKTLAATAAGVPPDIAGLWTAQLVQYALRGALTPLDDMARERGIDPAKYKPVYWDICSYEGKLSALPTTPAVVALHYNKRFFYEAADKLYAAGLDPTRPPQTLQEFDRYAKLLDVPIPGTNRLARAGYFTMDTGWYIMYSQVWFGGGAWDTKTQKYTLLRPENIAAYEWVASYSKRMGSEAFMDFKSGLGGFASPTNPFLSGAVAMVQQGPWMGNYAASYNPDMSQVIVPFALEPFLPRVVRPFNYEWAVAAFPSAVMGDAGKDVSYNETDILVIPRGAKHPRESFEFLAYVQRPEVMEKLGKLTGKHSVLKKNSDNWLYTHRNPYVDVFDRLAASPNAAAIDQTPIYSEGLNEIDLASQQIYLLQKTPVEALTEAQQRLDARLARYHEQRALRGAK